MFVIRARCDVSFQTGRESNRNTLFKINHAKDVDSNPVNLGAWLRLDMFESGAGFAKFAEVRKNSDAPIKCERIVREILDRAVVGRQRFVQTAHGAQRLGTPGPRV